MTSRLKLVVGLLLVAALVWWFWPAGGGEAEIKRRLDELVELVEKSGNESTLEAAGRGKQLAGFFAESARIEYLPGRTLLLGGDETAAVFLQARSMAEAISIFVLSHQVELDDSGETARSKVRATAGVTLRSGETESETLTHGLGWEKRDGEWRISRAEVLKD